VWASDRLGIGHQLLSNGHSPIKWSLSPIKLATYGDKKIRWFCRT
jgi:hypothetical protein